MLKVNFEFPHKLEAGINLMKLRSGILAICALLFAGCQTSANFQTPVDYHDYGPQPQIQASELESYIGTSLKDEKSARYKFGDPARAYCNHGLLSGGKVVWTGWVVPFQVNAKNSFGGYVGFENRYARYSNGELLDVAKPSSVGPFDFSPKLGTGCKIVQ